MGAEDTDNGKARSAKGVSTSFSTGSSSAKPWSEAWTAEGSSIRRSSTAFVESGSQKHGSSRHHKSSKSKSRTSSTSHDKGGASLKSSSQGGASLRSPGQGGASLGGASLGKKGRHRSMEDLLEEEEEDYEPPKPRRDRDYGPKSIQSRFDDGKPIKKNKEIIPDEEIPVHQDFNAAAGHDFWTWDFQAQNWYHRDPRTGMVSWAPRSFS